MRVVAVQLACNAVGRLQQQVGPQVTLHAQVLCILIGRSSGALQQARVPCKRSLSVGVHTSCGQTVHASCCRAAADAELRRGEIQRQLMADSGG